MVVVLVHDRVRSGREQAGRRIGSERARSGRKAAAVESKKITKRVRDDANTTRTPCACKGISRARARRAAPLFARVVAASNGHAHATRTPMLRWRTTLVLLWPSVAISADSGLRSSTGPDCDAGCKANEQCLLKLNGLS